MTMKRDVDMSPEAVAARLETVRGLYKLCMSLLAAGNQAKGSTSTDPPRDGSYSME